PVPEIRLPRIISLQRAVPLAYAESRRKCDAIFSGLQVLVMSLKTITLILSHGPPFCKSSIPLNIEKTSVKLLLQGLMIRLMMSFMRLDIHCRLSASHCSSCC